MRGRDDAGGVEPPLAGGGRGSGGAGGAAERDLSALAAEPDWTKLEQYQGTMGRAEFTRLLDTVYAPGGAWKNTIRMAEDGAHVLTTGTNDGCCDSRTRESDRAAAVLEAAGRALPAGELGRWRG